MAARQTHAGTRVPERHLPRRLFRAISGRCGPITRVHSGIREPCGIGWQSGTLRRARPPARIAPTDILDFVLVEAVVWAQREGYRAVNLGLAPLRGLDRRDTVSRWNRLGTYLYRYGEHYSDFSELRRAKAGFAPRWEPRFVSSRPGLALARAIPDVAQLVAGGSGAKPAREAI